MRSIETTLTVDGNGAVHLDQPIPLAPGRHHAVIVIDERADEPKPEPAEPWAHWLDRMYGSLRDSDLQRYPQGEYEQRETLE